MEVILLDQNLEVLSAPIDGFQSLLWKKSWTECGNFQLYLDGTYFQTAKKARYLFQSEEDDTAIIEENGYTDSDGTERFSLQGRHLNALLYDCVIPKTEQLRGNAEAKIRSLVQKYAIDDPTQKIAKLQLGPLQGYTESIDTQVTGVELGEALYSLLNPLGMSWELRYDFENDVIYFNILKGKDRTQDQTENAWATFSTSRENIRSTEYTYNDSDYKNYAYVAGGGEGTDRVVVEVDESHGEKIRSLYVDARDIQREEDDKTQDMFILCGWYGKIATSTDAGKTWEVLQMPTEEDLFGTAYVNGRYLVCGTNGSVVISDDGIAWNYFDTGSDSSYEGACYYNGIYLVYGNDSTIMYSYNGSDWNRSRVPSPGMYIRKIIWGANQFVGVTISGTILTSKTGTDWNEYRPEEMLNSTCIAYHDGLYVITNQAGSIQLTPDLASFTTIQFGNSQELESVDYGDGVWVAVGKNGTICRSDDAVHWTVQPSGTTTELVGVAYGQGYFVAAARYLGEKIVLRSKDGYSWSKSNVSDEININKISFGTDYYKYTLRLRGLEKLKDYQKVEEITGAVDVTAVPVYGKDYQLGDICDFVNSRLGLNYQNRVNSVEFVYEAGERSVTPCFGTTYLDVRKFIQREASK